MMSSVTGKTALTDLLDIIDGHAPTKFIKLEHKKLTDNQYHKLFYKPVKREIKDSIDFDTVIYFINNCKEKSLLLACKKASKSRLDFLYSQEKLEAKK